MVEIESVCLIEGEEPDPRRKDLFRVEDGVRVVYYTNKDRLSFRIIEHENRYCYYYDSKGRTHRLNGPAQVEIAEGWNCWWYHDQRLDFITSQKEYESWLKMKAFQ